MGVHGLPSEHRPTEGRGESWEDVLTYLRALEGCGRPVVVAVQDARMDELNPRLKTPLVQHLGYLRELPVRHGRPDLHWFGIDWPERGELSGEVLLDERVFERARLSTADGDDYFDLEIDIGSVKLVFRDSNINMDHAVSEWAARRDRARPAPSAQQIQEEYLAPNDRYSEQLRREMADLRRKLITRGAVGAADLTDAELASEVAKAGKRLRDSGRSGSSPTGDEPLWLAELAEHLRAGPDPP